MAEVTFALTEEQQMLRQVTRQFLDEQVPISKVRELAESGCDHDPDLWKAGAELGWHGLAIPEAYGGVGSSFVELSIVLEEMGRTLFPGPFLSTVVQAASAILDAGSEEQKQQYLPKIASGDTIATMALFEHPQASNAADVAMAASGSDEGWILDGEKRWVVDADLADTLIVAANTQSGLSLFLVEADTPGVDVEMTPSLDTTRREGTVAFSGIRVGADALLGAEGSAGPVLDRVLALTSVALAIEQVGGAQWCLDTAVAYAKERYQFGRPIGSFQAVKHKCADMLVAVEHAKSAAYYAARVTDPVELAIAAPLAKAVASEAYLQAAGDTLQIHGGIGFTWDHDLHFFLKRAKATSLLFGGVREQRRRLGDALGL